MPSQQGEHIFNALGDLAAEQARVLANAIPHGCDQRVRDAAMRAVQSLQTSATDFIAARNHREFRTASQGDPANASRYATLCAKTRVAIAWVICREPSMHTRGYTELHAMLNDLESYALDATAYHSQARVYAGVGGARQREFETWFRNTRFQMHSTFTALLAAALAVNRTQLESAWADRRVGAR